MATPNFARPTNASKYFVVLTGREETIKECKDCNAKHYEWEFDLSDINHCEECESENLEETTEYVYPQDFEYDDLKSNIGSELEFLGPLMLVAAWRPFLLQIAHKWPLFSIESGMLSINRD